MSGSTTAIERLHEVSNNLWDTMYESGEVPTYAERYYYYLALKDVITENAKLKEERDGFKALSKLKDAQFNNVLCSVKMLKSENAKLQELCADIYEMAYYEYPSAFEAAFSGRMRELGIDGV